jgi:hypothetical protein
MKLQRFLLESILVVQNFQNLIYYFQQLFLIGKLEEIKYTNLLKT